MNVAVILAGGTGSRFGTEAAKQFARVAGKTILEHTLDVFETCLCIDEIAVVCHSNHIERVKDMLCANSYTKTRRVLQGGVQRSDSSLAAINAFASYPPDTKFIFHDAVRPLLSHRIIEDCVRALDDYNAVDVAIVSADTIVRIDPASRTIVEVPERARLRRGQTPQAFRLATISRAYKLALASSDEMHFTDDCGVVLRNMPDEKIFVVEGESTNVKLTTPEDISIIDRLFQHRTTAFATRLNDEQRTDLARQAFVIFGGASGIGRATCEMLKAMGCQHVFAFSRSLNQVDVTKPGSVQSALREVHIHTGRVDNVINCAGSLLRAPLSSMSYDDIFDTLNTNLAGSLVVAKESFQYLRESNGSLTLFTSSSYTRGRKLYAAYSSSKAGVVNLTEALEDEWRSANIRVNCISPARTNTPMRASNFGAEDQDALLAPDRVAEITLLTIASHVSGRIVDVRL